MLASLIYSRGDLFNDGEAQSYDLTPLETLRHILLTSTPSPWHASRALIDAAFAAQLARQAYVRQVAIAVAVPLVVPSMSTQQQIPAFFAWPKTPPHAARTSQPTRLIPYVYTTARGGSVADTFVFDYEDGASVTYSWGTDVLRSRSGKEHRLSIVSVPRETYAFDVVLNDGQINKLQSKLVDEGAAGAKFAVALSHESLLVSQHASSPTIEVPTVLLSDWIYPGQEAAILSKDGTRMWGGVVQGAFTATSITLDTLGLAAPRSARDLQAAVGFGDLSSAKGWQLNDSAGALAASFGGLALAFGAGTGVYGEPGPLGGVDKAIGFGAGGATWWQGGVGSFNVGPTDGLFVLWVAKHLALPPPNAMLTTKSPAGGSPGWRIFADNAAGGIASIVADDGINGITTATPNNDNGLHVGEWHVGIAVIDTSSSPRTARIGTIGLSSRRVSLSPQTLVLGSDFSNATNFTLGMLVGGSNASPSVRVSQFYACAGPAVSGIASNLGKALDNFARWLMPSVGDRIMPSIPAYLDDAQGLGLFPANAGRWTLRAKASYFGDRLSGWSPDGATISTYTDPNEAVTYPVFDRRVLVDSKSPRVVATHTELIDKGGVRELVSMQATSNFARELRMLVENDADRQYLKLFHGTVRGRTKAFLMPTWKPDLIAIGDASAGTLKVHGPPSADVGDYVGGWFASGAHHNLQLMFADGSVAYVSISDCTDNADGTHTLQLDRAVAGTISMVSLLERCRLDSDDIPVIYKKGIGYCRVPVIVVLQ